MTERERHRNAGRLLEAAKAGTFAAQVGLEEALELLKSAPSVSAEALAALETEAARQREAWDQIDGFLTSTLPRRAATG